MKRVGLLLLASCWFTVATILGPQRAEAQVGGVNYDSGGYLSRMHDPIVRDSADWVDDLDAYSQMPTGSVVIGDWLFGYSRNSRIYGVLAWNGKAVRQGGKTNNICGGTLWTDGTAAYAMRLGATNGGLAKVTYSGKVGSFVQGEAVTQDDSNASGWFIRDDGTYLYIQDDKNDTDAWAQGAAGSHTVHAAGSGASAEADVVATDTAVAFLQMSTDGFTDFKTVLDLRDSLYPTSFIDCGTPGTDHILLVIEVRSAGTGTETDIWWNKPDDDTVWTKLGSSVASSFRHCHGGVMIEGVNGTTTDRLILMCGDSDHQPSIVICDDVDDLLANWSTWKTRWGWDQEANAAKTAYLTTGAGAPYCYGAGNQLYRVCQIIPDIDKRYAYYLPDEANLNGTRMAKVDLVEGTISQPGTTEIIGEGAWGIGLSNGSILLTTFAATDYGGNSDNYLRCYVVNETGTDVKELWAKEVRSGSTGASIRGFAEFPSGSTSVADTNCVWFTSVVDNPNTIEGDTIVGRVFRRGRGLNQFIYNKATSPRPAPLVNLIPNGRFINGWISDALSSGVRWTASNATVTKETSIVDAAGGNSVSMECTPTGTGLSYVQHSLDSSQLDKVRGQWVTLSGRVLWNTDEAASVLWYDDSGGSLALDDTPIAKSASWQTFSGHFFVPLAATSAYIRLYSRTAGAGTDPCYWSDMSLVVGAYPNRVPANLPSTEDNYATIIVSDDMPDIQGGGQFWFDTNAGGAEGTLYIWSDVKSGGAGWEVLHDFN